MVKYTPFFGLFGSIFFWMVKLFLIFLRSEVPPGSATMGSEFDVP